MTDEPTTPTGTTAAEAEAAIAALAGRFPQTFAAEGWQPHRPLKVGIAGDLLAAGVPEGEVRQALRHYVRRRRYLEACTAGAARVDLAGEPCGAVTQDQAAWAAEKVAEIDARRTRKAVASRLAWQAREAERQAAGKPAGKPARKAAERAATAPAPSTPVAAETPPRASCEAPRRASLADLRAAARARAAATVSTG